MVYFGKHILTAQALYHIIGRNYYIIGYSPAFELGIHGLVAFEGSIIDLDARKPLKFAVYIDRIITAVRDIFTPIIDIKHSALE